MFKDYGNIRVLIVDDQKDVLMVLKAMLEGLGVKYIFEASNGREAYECLEEAKEVFNFIICDWNMPELDGFQFLKRAKLITPNIPFLMLTGRCDMSSVMDAKKAGVNGYLRKPFTSEQLDCKLKTFMPKSTSAFG